MKKAGIGLLLITLLIGIFGYLYLKSSIKSYTDQISLSSLNDSVTIRFDEYAIPHIYANNDEDAYHALGYVHASDRLFQMELLRRVGGGSLSEILGEKLISTDKYIRTLGLNDNAIKAAKAFEESTDLRMKDNVYAYIRGINDFIDNGTTPIEYHILGIEKSYFTVTDVYRALGYMGFGFSMELKAEPLNDWIYSNLGVSYLNDISIPNNSENTIIPVNNKRKDTTDFTHISSTINDALQELPVPLFYGSNSWVIGSGKTKNGKVLFANDTHIGFTQPSVWYEAHIETPTQNFYGNFVAGVPFPLIGHNLHHSWGLTIFPVDQMDLYKETIKGANVLYKNEWTPLTYREETIVVKDNEPITFKVISTPHGPIISELNNFNEDLSNPVSVWWVSNHITDQKLQALATLVSTNDFTKIEKAAELIDAPGLNIMYGDVDGNIAWFGAAKLIERPNHVNSKIILDGATGKDDPIGFYDFSKNPKNVNPKSDFVVSANNQPDSVDGIFYSGYYYAGARAKVISDIIKDKDDWDIDAMKELVMIDKSPIYPENGRIIAEQIEVVSDIEKTVLATLTEWDGKHGLSDIAPTIYYKLIYHILELSMVDEIGTRRFGIYLSTPVYLHSITPYISNDSSAWWDNINTEVKETRSDIFNRAFKTTVSELTDQLGDNVNEWKWGRVHFLESPHPIGKQKPLDKIFNVGPYPCPGGEEVINKIAFTLNADGIYISRSGPAMRILLDFTDIENSLSINPTGQSGNFMNPHYSDQTMMYINGGFRKQKMNKQDIISTQIGVWIFTPQ